MLPQNYQELDENTLNKEDDPMRSFLSVRASRRQKKPAILIGVLLGVIVAFVVGWFTLGEYVFLYRDSADGILPVIVADTTPDRILPKTPGGLEVPDQDKLVYERLRQNKDDLRVEKLLPSPETPSFPDEEELSQEDQMKMLVSQFSDEETQIASGMILDEKGKPVEVMFKTTNEVIIASKPVLQAPIKVSPKELPKENAKEPVNEKQAEILFSVQLFSVKSKETAEKEAKRLIKKYAEVVGSLTYKIQEISVEKGVFYRLRVGSFKNRDEAKLLCDQFKSKKQECIVVK